MSINHAYLHLPYPLPMAVDRVPDDNGPEFRATSQRWPNVLGRGRSLDEAVDSLLRQVSDMQPLKAGCLDALRAAGYDDATIDAWTTHITGFRLWALRHDGREATERLAGYVERGVDPVAACHFLAIGLTPYSAGTLNEQGVSPSAAAPYVDAIGELWDEHYDEFVPLVTARNQRDLVQWILSGFTPDQARFYEEASAAPTHAEKWHETVERHAISADDLHSILRAGFSPEAVDADASRDADGVFGPAKAARTMIALGAPRRTSYSQGHYSGSTNDPWAPPNHAWGSTGEESP